MWHDMHAVLLTLPEALPVWFVFVIRMQQLLSNVQASPVELQPVGSLAAFDESDGGNSIVVRELDLGSEFERESWHLVLGWPASS